jgi:hypothetical protein
MHKRCPARRSPAGGGNVHAIAIDVVASTITSPRLTPSERRCVGLGIVALWSRRVLNRNCALDRIHDAAELGQCAVAHQLDDAAAIFGDTRVE